MAQIIVRHKKRKSLLVVGGKSGGGVQPVASGYSYNWGKSYGRKIGARSANTTNNT